MGRRTCSGISKRIADNYKINVNINPIDRRDVERVRLQGRSIRGLSGKSVPARKFKVLCKEKDIAMEYIIVMLTEKAE